MEDDEEINLLEDDYYTFLNVPKDASYEEINNAYRRLSRLFHPDKHTHPTKKKDAELLFLKTKKAYEVLSDPHKRAIYDNLGTKGLETEGWEIVQRTKTPQEIREEYERLARERKERRLLQRTNPRGNVTVNINATELFAQHDDDDYEDIGLPLFEISGTTMSLSIEAPITMRNKLTFDGEISTSNGTGDHTLTMTGRRLLEGNKWLEAEVAIGSGVALNFRHFRTLTRRVFGTGTLQFRFSEAGIHAGVDFSTAMQLREHTMGYLTWRAGLQTAMITSVVHSTDNARFEAATNLGIPHSFVSLHCSYSLSEKKLKLRSLLKAGTFGALFEYSVEKRISEQSLMSAAVTIGIPTGVRLRIRLVRGNYAFVLPIHLCEEPTPSPIFYANLVPLVAYFVVKYAIIDPIMIEEKEMLKEKQKQANKTRMAEMKKEATAAVNLMEATFSRIRADEESHNGLVIVRALYGLSSELTNPTDGVRTTKDEVIDVTIPLQCLVKDSKLSLHNASKSQLSGFYDPCAGEEKVLYIQYLHHKHLHEVISPDEESLSLPKQSHRVNAT